jgi:hypothetical protein
MELNPLVFPAPPSSYTHETLNSGAFLEALHELREAQRGAWAVKVKMLYVPKFEMHVERKVPSALGVRVSRCL